MYFAKMHGLGNDFIVINNLDGRNIDYSNLARKICDRHFGIGADGLLVVEKSKIADIKMLIFNSDGSQAEMCGNGIRCFAKYVFEKEILKKKK
ncbi:diaminopimelate epimerase [Caloramator sp. Dgby_cultured_2]|uniref:diaminopimelate epimerase n=1 Tax=Caloramator sp. Dgby_cultured_2 TaxID=3029174 RepID=UPI00237E4507|nr:diaminopimelate epimerase [Caloramator sp. Dgby_cultured_2]WDU84088.1 diaminopimelate epimerase [Caloramator sp. Dgby_cultured_2]